MAKLVLTIEAEGDYKKAGEVLAKYGVMNDWLTAIPLDKGENKPIELIQVKN